MNMTMGLLIGVGSVFLISCTNSPTSQTREPAGIFGATRLEDQSIFKISSSGPLDLSEGHIIVDNDAAFESKLKAIQSAKAGETIRMVYYIYSTDESSSVISYELLQASQRGVRVKLLVDYPTNFTNLDTFFMLEKKSAGMIQVRLYGRPSDLMVRDSLFLSRPCPETSTPSSATTCSDSKWSSITAELAAIPNKSVYSDFFSGLLLSGIYGRSATSIKIGLLMGQQIDLKKYREGTPSSPEQQKALFEFFKLLFDAKVKGDLVAAIKVQLALVMHGEELTPLMNEISGHLPINQMAASSGKDWEHSTDFTHHKLLLVGDRFFQLGGRNIENSYHMKKNNLSAKYTFMDTDFAGVLRSGGQQIARSYDELFDFSAMTADIENVYKLSPNDFAKNPDAASRAVELCASLANKNLKERAQLSACLEKSFWKSGAKNQDARIEDEYTRLIKGRERYFSEYFSKRVLPTNWKTEKGFAFELSSQERSQLVLAYLENLHYDKRKPLSDRTRLYGTFNNTEFFPWSGNEQAYGKNIHALWMKGLENTCAASSKDGKPRRVLIHSAYFLPPANLLRVYGKMMDGTWDCSKVRVTFMTNSFETTDLNYINIYARYEMKAFFDAYASLTSSGLSSKQRSAKFEYYEYLPIRDSQSSVTKDSTISLHSKVSVLGDDMIVGSANSDVRSLYMDTNNGVYLRNAPETVQAYLAWVDEILNNPTRARNLTPDHLNGKISFERLEQEDVMMFKALIGKTKFKDKISPKILEYAKQMHLSFAKSVSEMTQIVLSKDFVEMTGTSEANAEDQEKLKIQRQKEAAFNRALQLL